MEEKVYVPELIFGHLLTSSNYDDDEKKVRTLSDMFLSSLNASNQFFPGQQRSPECMQQPDMPRSGSFK